MVQFKEIMCFKRFIISFSKRKETRVKTGIEETGRTVGSGP